MASLDLKPEISVIVVQMLFICINILLVKFLMYQPFLVVWKKRKELSEGNKVTTSAALEKTEAEKRRYKELLKAHVQKIEVKKLEAKVAVEGEIKAILMEARKEADTFYRDEQAKLQSQIKLERTKVFKMLGQIEQQVMSSIAG